MEEYNKMSYNNLLNKINEEIKRGAKTFDELSSGLKEEISSTVPPEIVYKNEGMKQIEDIKHFIGLF